MRHCRLAFHKTFLSCTATGSPPFRIAFGYGKAGVPRFRASRCTGSARFRRFQQTESEKHSVVAYSSVALFSSCATGILQNYIVLRSRKAGAKTDPALRMA
ncbi:MAG: hypothetical protein AMXMBFR16_06440 [Candidatus Uhrbacteria bacterium]|jgi:hypothetical protein